MENLKNRILVNRKPITNIGNLIQIGKTATTATANSITTAKCGCKQMRLRLQLQFQLPMQF